jgi:threonine dehydratase
MRVSNSQYSAPDVAADVQYAVERIRPYVRETPLEESFVFSQESGARVFLKLESAQVSGSFKARGAFNKLLSLDAAERAAGIVTASTGNHALATAQALATLGIQGEIFLPRTASAVKVDALRARGARLRLIDADPGAVEVAARAHAGETGRVYVSPYNDRQIIGGQGTIAVEILKAHPSIDTVIVPVGGGGLIAGIAGFLKSTDPRIQVVGCQPRASAVMTHSVESGRQMDLPSDDSISDATVGLVEHGSITFPICQTCVDEWVLLEEPEIRSAVRMIAAQHSILIEGAAALAVAAFRRQIGHYAGKTVVLILSGSHIGLADLAQILAANPGGGGPA